MADGSGIKVALQALRYTQEERKEKNKKDILHGEAHQISAVIRDDSRKQDRKCSTCDEEDKNVQQPKEQIVKNSQTQDWLRSLLGKANSLGRGRHKSCYLWKHGVAMVT